jgi:hypothetical protein
MTDDMSNFSDGFVELNLNISSNFFCQIIIISSQSPDPRHLIKSLKLIGLKKVSRSWQMIFKQDY